MKELTLQIKPVGNHCNLRCSYCYAMPFKSPKFDKKLKKCIINPRNGGFYNEIK